MRGLLSSAKPLDEASAGAPATCIPYLVNCVQHVVTADDCAAADWTYSATDSQPIN